MRRAKKKRLFNIIMVAIIAAIVFSGVMAVGSIRGWFSDEETISVSKVLGNATIERNGIAYSLTEGTALQAGDSIGTLDGSTASLGIASLGSLTLGENTQVTIHSAEGSEISIEAEGGEVFGNVDGQAPMALILNVGDRIIATETAVFSLSAPSGSQSVYVYSGSVDFEAENFTGETSAKAGQAATLLADDSGGTVCLLSPLSAVSLNDFLIQQIQMLNDAETLCFTDAELESVLADRQNELLMIAAEKEAHEQELLAQGGNVMVCVDGDEEAQAADEDTSPGGSSSGGGSTGGTSTSKPAADDDPAETTAPTADADDRTDADGRADTRAYQSA